MKAATVLFRRVNQTKKTQRFQSKELQSLNYFFFSEQESVAARGGDGRSHHGLLPVPGFGTGGRLLLPHQSLGLKAEAEPSAELE